MQVILIGMAGVGKSYIGKKLVERLKVLEDWDFVDLDERLKKETGLDTTSLLKKVGDQKFLDIENEVFLKELAQANGKSGDTVFAPGGSIVYCHGFTNIKNQKGNTKILTFYLKGDMKTILERIKKEPRGIVFSSKMSIEQLFAEREKLYEKYSDYNIEVKKDVVEILNEICDIIFLEKNSIC